MSHFDVKFARRPEIKQQRGFSGTIAAARIDA
jgi:hypothetical protein